MIQQMHLDERYYKAIKNGTKTIEMRLNDEKRQQLKVGDILEFENRKDGEVLKTTITNIYHFSNFKEIFDNFDREKLGFSKDEDFTYKNMEEFYSIEEQEKYGVIAIEIKLGE